MSLPTAKELKRDILGLSVREAIYERVLSRQEGHPEQLDLPLERKEVIWLERGEVKLFREVELS